MTPYLPAGVGVEVIPPRADLGPLAAALAKAQLAFPVITRDKKVTVTSKKTGTSYSFSYAPLDQILGATRGPLAENGLAIVQMLDGGALVTTLLHESGASITGRVTLPPTDDIQGMGSAITYLRRYAIQAALGIAAEEDDDGNRAAGNTIKADVERGDDGSLIGTAEAGDKASSDFLLRQTPDGSSLGFRLRGAGRQGGILVEARGPLADQLHEHKAAVIDQRVTVWGAIASRTFTPKGGKEVTYQVLAAERVRAPGLPDMPTDTTPEPAEAPGGSTGLSEAESEAIWAEMGA